MTREPGGCARKGGGPVPALPPLGKVRKPRNIEHGYGFYCLGGPHWLRMLATPHASVARLREMHNWLGRYIAWREQEETQ